MIECVPSDRVRSCARTCLKLLSSGSAHRSLADNWSRFGPTRVTTSSRSRYSGSLIGPSPIVGLDEGESPAGAIEFAAVPPAGASASLSLIRCITSAHHRAGVAAQVVRKLAQRARGRGGLLERLREFIV